MKDRRILWLFIGFSITHFINIADVLLRSFHQDYHIPRYNPLMLVGFGDQCYDVCLCMYIGMEAFREIRQQEQKVEDAPVT